MKILDCESIESTYKSLETILGLTRPDFCELFEIIKVYPEDDMRESYCGFLFSQIQEKTNCAGDFDKTCWFHATRTWRDNTFEEGLLPLDKVIDKIWDFLFGLTEGQVTAQEWMNFRDSMQPSNFRWANLYRIKPTDKRIHGGPYALLVREAVIETAKNSRYWNYFEIPEIVDDICKCCPFDIDLRNKFITRTAPCIVKFINQSTSKKFLSTALLYVYHDYHKPKLNLRSDELNLSFDGRGVLVPSKCMRGIEFF